VRSNLVRGLAIAYRASPRSFALAAAIALINAALPPIEVWLGKHLVDLLVLGEAREAADLAPTVVALGIVFGGHRVVDIFRWHNQELFVRRVERHVMRIFLAKAATVDMGYFDDPTWHDAATRARRDVSWLPSQLTFMAFELLGSAATIAGMVALLSTMHPLLGVLLLASVVPWIVLQRRTNRALFEAMTGDTPTERERGYMSSLLSEPQTAKEVRSFGLGDHLLERYTSLARDIERNRERLFRRATIAAVVSGLVTAAASALAYQFVAMRGLTGALTAGDLTASFAAFAAVASQSYMMSHQLGQLERHTAFLDDFFRFLEVEPLVRVPAQPKVLPPSLAPGIVMEGVRFTYPQGTREALTGLDLEVRPGELVALVGENGAGKTTIVNLLSRFYDPTAGRIAIGGVDLRDVDPVALRARVGVLLQDFAKYQLTLRDNVQLGRVDRAGTDADVVRALEAARAMPIVDGLAKGLDARLGRLFEGGHDLSGGEWQRLAVARLIYRGADIWILDEPTSNLDPEAEAKIFSELKQQLAGRMAIVISHRFSTVRVADRIYVIDDGRVLESGKHDELVAARGRYAELFEIQAAGYR
jgi:ATP-binding cassette subfamily B protein